MSLNYNAESRLRAVNVAADRQPRPVVFPTDSHGRVLKTSDYFGVNVFDLRKLKNRLTQDVQDKLESTLKLGQKLDPSVAAPVAEAIREWALERGATHYCHWFQPQTGSTAEKHDSFLHVEPGKSPIEKFTASHLIQSEPDASSFPSGGMRTTFEARGYTAWDPSSPVFVVETPSSITLCIPSVFISYHGQALDEKTSLLRSMEAISKASTELLHAMGSTSVQRVVPTLGAEQEYFLIDRGLAALRPDLLICGRSLLGGQPPKGQQLEDHYFGSIPVRVQAFMQELEVELYRVGVPIKTRHNEVAPSQFEMAPIFEEVDVATDHNHLTMELARKIARRHQFEILFHEKPFAGINGSGKHCNWSLAISAAEAGLEGQNLLEPGKTPSENLSFLLFLSGVLKGVHQHAGLLRAAIASHGNDHRLGANEAPPAIISVFLGNTLDRILNEIESGAHSGKSPERAVIDLGIHKLPSVNRDNTDRNRTSPFAFTGNKFEFRAVGSSANVAFPLTILNAAAADGLQWVTKELTAKLQAGTALPQAILETVRTAVIATKSIRFEGNNYSQEWVDEAKRRGLLNLKKTPEALEMLRAPSAQEMLDRLAVFSPEELEARYHIRLERYVKSMAIEVDTLRQMIDTSILPTAIQTQAFLADSVVAAQKANVAAPQQGTLTRVTELLQSLYSLRRDLDGVSKRIDAADSELERAKLFAAEASQIMLSIRAASDELESIVPDSLWPLPKYRELVFAY